MKSFEKKQAIITGAASGIGRALAQQLAAVGADLHLVDVDFQGLQTVQNDLSSGGASVTIWSCDLSDSNAVDAWLDDFSATHPIVDLLINNAGVAYYGPTEAMTMDQWTWLMNINLNAPIRITQRFLPVLIERPTAHIVNMCSISGLVAGGRFTAYHTSKFGLIGYTEAIRAEYGRKGVGVTAICPGPVKTALYDKAESARADRSVPTPPNWLCALPETVARKNIRAIRKNKRQVLITPMAHGLFQMKKLAPGLIDFANQFSRKKKKRLAEKQRREEERLQQQTQQQSEPVRRAA